MESVSQLGDGMKQVQILSIPGWNGSGADHWQSLWEKSDRRIERVRQADWTNPDLQLWTATLEAHVSNTTEQLILVAHSLGCLTVAHWATRSVAVDRVAAALLVAPPWCKESDLVPPAVQSFLPIPKQRLPFPSTLVASRNDPYSSFASVAALGRAWGSELIDVGHAGHINASSGHGTWDEGRALLDRLLRRSQEPVAVASV
jgi:uncharacterized protein